MLIDGVLVWKPGVHNPGLVPVVPKIRSYKVSHPEMPISQGNVLCNVIKHQNRPIPILLIHDLEPPRVVEGVPNTSEGMQQLGHRSGLRRVKGVLVLKSSACQTFLHVIGSEERVQGVDGVLQDNKVSLEGKEKREADVPKGNDEASAA